MIKVLINDFCFADFELLGRGRDRERARDQRKKEQLCSFETEYLIKSKILLVFSHVNYREINYKQASKKTFRQGGMVVRNSRSLCIPPLSYEKCYGRSTLVKRNRQR